MTGKYNKRVRRRRSSVFFFLSWDWVFEISDESIIPLADPWGLEVRSNGGWSITIVCVLHRDHGWDSGHLDGRPVHLRVRQPGRDHRHLPRQIVPRRQTTFLLSDLIATITILLHCNWGDPLKSRRKIILYFKKKFKTEKVTYLSLCWRIVLNHNTECSSDKKHSQKIKTFKTIQKKETFLNDENNP